LLRTVVAPESPDDGSLALASILPLLYPDADDFDGLFLAAQAALGRNVVTTTADLRTILGHIDRQFFPSPIMVAFRPEDVVLTEIDGTRLALDRSDGSVSAMISDGHYEPHVSAVLAKYCTPGTSVVDAGANIGYHTVALARHVGPSGLVTAFEPSSENCRLLERSLRENAITNVDLVPVALAERRGWAYFTHHLGSNGGLFDETGQHYTEGGGTIVPTFRLDDLVKGRVDLVKLDLEGGEGSAIQGALATLERERPVVVSELNFVMLHRVSKMDPQTYLSFFTRLGYHIHVIDRDQPGNLIPVESAETLMVRWPHELHVEDLLLLP
jgi:FkbM family methyltransferase